ncbi:MAG: SRPBCC domain-containing protein [Chloroflexota bacterium]
MIISKSVQIKRSPEDAFRLFVDEMGKWWPLHTGKYSYGGDRAQDVFLEARLGGRFYERYKDGEEFDIGQVTACERPNRIVFTWGAAGEATTEVDVRFTPSAGGTQVELEHRGVEKMGEQAHGFDKGWDDVLGYYVRAA